jgi:hydroxypyruvate reductase/glycerate 2-kinase
MQTSASGRDHARRIFEAGLAAVDPVPLVADAVAGQPEIVAALGRAKRVVVVGGGKAGAGMAAGLELGLADRLGIIKGVVNVPDALMRPTRRIRLNASRPTGCNEPTPAAAAGADEMLRLAGGAGPGDVVIALLSGGGSALLPAPAAGVSLDDKIALTRLLAACGADIHETNCVRKHVSRIKGGRLAAASPAPLFALIISDVPGDPLDVIASGPTVPDPTTFADTWAVMERYRLTDQLPAGVANYLDRGRRGQEPESPKRMTGNVHNHLLAGGATALRAAEAEATRLGYRVVNLGDQIAGDAQSAARFVAGLVRSVRRVGLPSPAPCCLLLGGEVTVALPADAGCGGRNQHFTLALVCALVRSGLGRVTVLSAGTDGEDGPTDAAGAFADAELVAAATVAGLEPQQFLARHDAYHFFHPLGGLLKTDLTGTNVADLRVVLIHASAE